VRFLLVTIQGFETDFYGRVGAELRRQGHEVSHLAVSRVAASRLRAEGEDARGLPELVEALGPYDLEHEVERIEQRYQLSSIRDLYRADPVCDDRPESASVRRAVEYVLALERLIDELAPDVLVPEVGRETIRIAAHRVALDRGVRTFFLFYTIFPHPLRLYVDTMQAPIVPLQDVRELTRAEHDELEAFRVAFIARDEPIRAHRTLRPTARRVRRLAGYLQAKAGADRDNEYLRPIHWSLEWVAAAGRGRAARRLYRDPDPARPFVYFPLHDIEDYKIKSLIPHLADQGAIVDQLAHALPPGVDLVLKEHPLSIGRNPLSLLRRLLRQGNVRLVDPKTSTHDLIGRSAAVAVISSTVGLEALLHEKPVLTLGTPFYAGYGITVDITSTTEIADGVAELLRFEPDRERTARMLHAAMRSCYEGAPVLVDDSDLNARQLAHSLDAAAAVLHEQATAVP
jgi:hypothetical protein